MKKAQGDGKDKRRDSKADCIDIWHRKTKDHIHEILRITATSIRILHEERPDVIPS